MTQLRRSLGLFDLVLFNIVAIVGLRWLATAARTGPSSILLWLLALAGFFLPSAFAVVALSTRYPDEGGIYVWTKHAFGEFHGFLCGWLYWMSNLSYFPALLVFAATAGLYVGGDRYLSLADNRYYLFAFTVSALLVAIVVSVIGLNVGKWIQNLGTLGTWVPAGLLVIFGVVAAFKFGSASAFTLDSLAPQFDKLGTITFWSTMCFAFAGLELASTMGGEIVDPVRNIPRAVFLSGVSIALIYILGTTAILVALPHDQLSVISAVPDAIGAIGKKIGLPAAAGVAGGLIALAGIGGTCAWFAGSARLPFVAGLDRYLPPSFGALHPKFGTPYVSILVQGVLSLFLMVMATLGEKSKIEEIYQVLVDMAIIIYFIPFIYLFASLLRLRESGPPRKGVIPVPCGKWGNTLAALLGLLTTIISIVLACIPSDDVQNKTLFFFKVVGGCGLFVVMGVLAFAAGHRRFHRKNVAA